MPGPSAAQQQHVRNRDRRNKGNPPATPQHRLGLPAGPDQQQVTRHREQDGHKSGDYPPEVLTNGDELNIRQKRRHGQSGEREEQLCARMAERFERYGYHSKARRQQQRNRQDPPQNAPRSHYQFRSRIHSELPV